MTAPRIPPGRRDVGALLLLGGHDEMLAMALNGLRVEPEAPG